MSIEKHLNHELGSKIYKVKLLQGEFRHRGAAEAARNFPRKQRIPQLASYSFT